MNDKQGRQYARLGDLRSGSRVEVDGGFTCMRGGEVKVVADDGRGLYVPCGCGKHFLDGQLERGYFVGVYPAP